MRVNDTAPAVLRVSVSTLYLLDEYIACQVGIYSYQVPGV